MATIVSRLEAVLTAQTRDFERAMDRSEGRMQKIGRTAGVAGLAIAGGLAVGLDKSVKAAMEAQISQARLDQAFKTAGLSANQYRGVIDKAETSSRNLGFAGNQTREALGSLVVATHNSKKAIADLGIAEDLARFKHVGLAEATKMITSASAGNARAIKQLGILLVPLTDHVDALKNANVKATTEAGRLAFAHAHLQDKLETAAHAVDLVREKVKGQGAAFAQTAAGSMQVFHERLQFIEVTIGTALLPVLTKLTQALSSLLDWFSKNKAIAQLLLVSLGSLAAVLLTVSVVTKVVTAATKIYTATQWLLNAALTANPIGVVIVALAALGVALVVAYKKVAFFRDGVNSAWSWIKDHWPLLVGIMGGPIGIVVEQIITRRDQIVNIFKNLPGDIASAFTAGTDLVKNAIVGLFHKVIHWVKSALGIASPSSVFYEIGKNSILGFVHGVGSMAGVLKNAVVGMAESLPGKVVGALGVGGTTAPPGGLGQSSGSADSFRKFAISQLPKFGWGTDQFAPLNALWNQESGWNPEAKGSYVKGLGNAGGIPQALPYTKMPKVAWPHWAGGAGNAFAQILWGMQYIKGAYGSPARAWAQDVAGGLKGYAMGGIAGLRGPEVARVGESGPEAIIPLTKIATATAGMTWAQKMQDFMQRVWSVAAPFYGGGSMPIADFLAPGSGMGAAQIEGEGAWGSGKYPPAGKRRILWPAELTQALFGIRGKGIDSHYSLGNLHQWALNTLLHEWTHAFQGRSATGKEWTAEGGAVDFVKMFGHSIYSMLGIDYNSGFSSGAIYEGFAKRVMSKLGPDWVAKGQFKSFDSGGWLHPGLTLAYNGTGRSEAVGGSGGDLHVYFPGYVGDESVVTAAVRDALEMFQNRNGRPAYGGGF